MTPIALPTEQPVRDVRPGPYAQAAGIVALFLFAVALVAAMILFRPVAPAPAAPALSLAVPPRVEPTTLIPVKTEVAIAINEKRAFDIAAPPAARPYLFAGDAAARARAVSCLAAAAWYESGDDDAAQRSVIQTVLNRARHPAYPGSVCGVVFQGSERRTGCQFTFTCDGALARTPSAAAWTRATQRAAAMLDGEVYQPIGWATHYHADYVVPYWAASLTKAAKVERHIFYLWPRYWGTGPAFKRGPSAAEPAVAALARFSTAHEGAPGAALAAAIPLAVDAALPVTPAAALPVLALEGVSTRSLGKTQVRGAAGDANRFFVELDAAGSPGRYAIAALAICKGKPACTVLGWRDPARMAGALPLDPAQGEALSFVYRRDATGERALWNCAQVPRANRAQCLPADPASAID